jgi:hypothetical protein
VTYYEGARRIIVMLGNGFLIPIALRHVSAALGEGETLVSSSLLGCIITDVQRGGGLGDGVVSV